MSGLSEGLVLPARSPSTGALPGVHQPGGSFASGRPVGRLMHDAAFYDASTVAEMAPATWPLYRKKVLTRALRVQGPFMVNTSEGPLRCEDGWLAVDARGYPYPIAADEFELIYERVSEPVDG